MNLSQTTKVLLLILLLVLIGVAAWYLYKEKNGNPVSGLKPRIEMGVGRINNFTDKTIDLTLNLLVDNPLPIGLDIEDFSYSVQMDGDTILENNYTEPLRIESRDSTVVTLPSQMNISTLKAVNERAATGRDSADYHFAGVFHLRKPVLGKDTLRLSMDKRLPRYRLPQVEVVGYDMKKFGLSESKIVLQLKFKNRNAFPIEFKDPAYEVDLGSQKSLAKGTVAGVTQVSGGSEEIYDIPLAVDMGDLLKSIGQLIGQGKSLPFKLNFNCTLSSDNEMFKNSDVNLIIEGDLEDLQKIKENIGN
ncbi:LEA type 2 family protein [Salmonirosea aquatica]|uniref:Water stress and hypersensitive response domain-containing protein n=1 Tax=Salmonirosea aquatica TaxID=2654236 RepID=A0A7C9FXN5_9BACT|nr:Water stress and hypersensitive response domain-containing protein [Cytophagaceae bacterium SJW1-29]